MSTHSNDPPDVAVHRHLSARLREAGCVFAEEEARLLMSEAGSSATLDRWLLRRCAGEPLEVLLGWADFWGLRVGINPGVFVPRRRTEGLVRAALEVAPPGGVVVDVCTGTGAIALALAHERPDLELYATDLHPTAVQCARDNLHGSAQVLMSDVLEREPGHPPVHEPGDLGRRRGRLQQQPGLLLGEDAAGGPEPRDDGVRVEPGGGHAGSLRRRRERYPAVAARRGRPTCPPS